MSRSLPPIPIITMALTLLPQSLPAAPRADLTAILLDALHQPNTWLSVHAAEYLVKVGHAAPVVDTFTPLADTTPSPLRIGIWRALALAEPTDPRRTAWADRIRQALLDPAAADRLHAMEALAKIGAPISTPDEAKIVRAFADKSDATSPFALWRLHQAKGPTADDRLSGLLASPDPTIRFRCAYVLAQLPDLPVAAKRRLSAALAREPRESPAYAAIACAIGGEAVLELATSPDPASRRLAAAALAARSAADATLFQRLLDDPDPEVRLSAAYGLLAREHP